VTLGTLIVSVFAVSLSGALGADWAVSVPKGFPPVPVPDDNPLTRAKVDLGRRLFFDPRLSSDGTIACASCHIPQKAFSDGLKISRGVGGQTGNRNAPSLLNVGYAPLLLWDGRSPGLEEQAQYPIMHPLEMNMNDKRIVEAVEADRNYAALFLDAFGSEEITYSRARQALASFERTLLSGDSPFDRYIFEGKTDAISTAAVRGWKLFSGTAGCIRCHRFEAGHPFLTDFEFHNSGVGYQDTIPDLGRFIITRERPDKGRFKTASLRNVALTAPYMHDGRFATLEEVLDHYDRGGTPNPFLDPAIRPLGLTVAERADIIEFLKTLTGSTATAGVPPLATRRKP
jgi:cytochrome c peroxidase